METPDSSEHYGSLSSKIQYSHLTKKELSELVSSAEDIIDFKVGQLKEDSEKKLDGVNKHYDIQDINIKTRDSLFSSVLEGFKLELENDCQGHGELHSTGVMKFTEKIGSLKNEMVDTIADSKKALKDADQDLQLSLKQKLIKLICEFDSSSIPDAEPLWSFGSSDQVDRSTIKHAFFAPSSPNLSDDHVIGNSVVDDYKETSDFVSFRNERKEFGITDVSWAREVGTITLGREGAIQNILPVKNGELWVLFRGTNALLRLTQNGQILRKVEVGKRYSYINDIFCSADYSTLYLSTEDSVYTIDMIDVNCNLKFLFKTKGEPVTLALTKGNDLIISLADGSPYEGFFREVVLFSTSGHSMNTFGKKRNCRELFGYPSKIKINRINGDIAIVNNRSVTVLSRTFLVKYRYKLKDDVEDSEHARVNVFYPGDVCFDSMSNLLFSDSVDNCIHVLDSTGQLKRVLRLNDKPKVLAFGPDEKLWVAFDCGKLQQFEYAM